MGQFHSPYVAMANNPVSMVDPTGGYAGFYNGETPSNGDLTMHPGSNVGMSEFDKMNPADRAAAQEMYGSTYAAQKTDQMLTLASIGGYDLGNGQTLKYDNQGNLAVGHSKTITTTQTLPGGSSEGIGYYRVTTPSVVFVADAIVTLPNEINTAFMSSGLNTFTITPLSFIKEKGKLSFEDAIWHYRMGQGQPVNVYLNTLDFSKVSVRDFNNPDFIHQGNPGKYISFDMPTKYTNPEQALIYGTIGVVYLGNNRIMALPDKYDFDIKGKMTVKGVFRDAATILGATYNGIGKPYYIQFMGTTKIK